MAEINLLDLETYVDNISNKKSLLEDEWLATYYSLNIMESYFIKDEIIRLNNQLNLLDTNIRLLREILALVYPLLFELRLKDVQQQVQRMQKKANNE